MKVVLDTNVLISGLLNPFGSPGEIVRLTASADLILCYDTRIFCEYSEVCLRPKFGFAQEHVDALLEHIRQKGELITPQPLPQHLPDIHDEMFLEAALAGQVQHLITGNSKHYPAKKRFGIKVVTPYQFLEIYRRKKRHA